VAREEQCRITELLGDAVPRFAGFAATGAVPPALVACADNGAAGGGAGTGGNAKAAKALLKCQSTITAAAGKLGKAIETTRQTCGAAVLVCRQLSTDPATCTAKAAEKCQSAVAKLGDAATGTGAAGKLSAAITKACDPVPLADLLGAQGLGFAAHGSDCAARGIAPLVASADIARCLQRQVTCRTGLRLEAEVPRLRELLELGQTPLP
jgi:hypothetical protein